MNILYAVDWSMQEAVTPDAEFPAYAAWLVKGYTEVRFAGAEIIVNESPVLIDLCELINAFSEKAMTDFAGDYLPINIGDEPELFICYGKDIRFYRRSPAAFKNSTNPVLETVGRPAVLTEGARLKRQILEEVYAHNPALGDGYRTLLW